ncbi:BON domain-containing protein [Sulfuriferula thiophila]|uniref:BON domain-containing protein n=1 Tax=Sulfuriferula thiophila TaxID=1781211 RepID=UPI00167C30F4|nr:BON domain-containing protein [Sulfuriferula thiophila]
MRKLVMVAVLGLALLQLQGCVPLVATGAGAGVLMANDRRSSGAYVEDQEIELRTSNRVGDAFPSDYVHVNVTSYNRAVLLTGEVPDEATKQKIYDIAKAVGNVKNVTNELVIAPPALLSARTNDAYVTTKVKTRFIDAKRFPVTAVKVVTENKVVYLMGLVTDQEGTDAAQIASTTAGVAKVVKMFEYVVLVPKNGN